MLLSSGIWDWPSSRTTDEPHACIVHCVNLYLFWVVWLVSSGHA